MRSALLYSNVCQSQIHLMPPGYCKQEQQTVMTFLKPVSKVFLSLSPSPVQVSELGCLSTLPKTFHNMLKIKSIMGADHSWANVHFYGMYFVEMKH